MNIEDQWHRLKVWCASNGLRNHGLRKPATESALDALEKVVGCHLPDAMFLSYRVHDGQNEDATPLFAGLARLNSVKEIEARWQADQWHLAATRGAPARLSADGWFHTNRYWPHRIPIAGGLDGLAAYIDFSPGPEGFAGQILVSVDEGEFVVYAEGFEHLLERTLGLMESKHLQVVNGTIERTGRPFIEHPATTLALSRGR